MTRTQISLLASRWEFTGPDGNTVSVSLPHTWNSKDGQDGGNDYWRGTCTCSATFAAPEFDAASQEVWLQFEGVNASATVLLNGQQLCTHDGGYSTFRAEVTELLQAENQLTVRVDNSVNDRVYPQKADFTFYGGIYRDVSLLVVNKNHIALGHFGDTGVKITPALQENSADIQVETLVEGSGTVTVELLDAEGRTVAKGEGENAFLHLDAPHLWNGVKDPYLYTCVVHLLQNGQPVDEVTTRVGLRSFSVDAKKGFFLNGRPYPLHGVSRHQDRKGLGNAITREMHDEDMALIRELAENGPCVIVGRAADCNLKNFPNSVHIFIHAPLSERIRRARDDYQEPMDNPERALQKKDKSRAAFYNTYSEYPWGDIRNYDMALNSSIGIDKSADIIWDYVKAKFGM